MHNFLTVFTNTVAWWWQCNTGYICHKITSQSWAAGAGPSVPFPTPCQHEMCRPEVSSLLTINHHSFRGHTTWAKENIVRVTGRHNPIDFSFIVFSLHDASLWRNILLRLRPTGTGNCLTSWWESVNRERVSEWVREPSTRHSPAE